MQINTKYSIGQSVWLVLDGFARHLKVERISTESDEVGSFAYYQVAGSGRLTREDRVFATRKALMDFTVNEALNKVDSMFTEAA